MFRNHQAIGQDFSPDIQWETLASMWFSELGIPIDLHTAASIGDLDGVKYWISMGADVNSFNKGGWTPLMYASYLGHEEACKVLLRCDGITIDARSADRRQTALMLASSCGNENIVKLLLKHGASIDAVDNKNRSSLHYATECNHAQVVRQLLLAGADPNLLADLNGQYVDGYMTPFQLACADGLDLMVQYFLQCGAAEKSTTVDGGRSLALKNGHTKVVQLIDNHGKGGSKLEEKSPLRKQSSVLDGPNAVSSLMKLQCNLVTDDSGIPIQGRDTQRDDYEQTLTLDKYPRPTTVEELLEILQLTKYIPAFKENKIDLEKLLSMNGDDLERIGIRLFGPRKKILNAIERWQQNVPLTGISGSDCTLLNQSGRPELGDYEDTLTVDQYPRPKTIEDLLEVLQLTKYLPVFKENNVDLDKLLTLDGDQLKDIGIKLFGPRKKLLNAIERWNQNVPLTGIL